MTAYDNAEIRKNTESMKDQSYLAAKRSFDLLISAAVCTLGMPAFIGLCAAIALDDPHGSPVFVQERVGKRGRLFKMYKLRTMCADAEAMKQDLMRFNESDEPVFKIENDPRITKVGKFLRRSHMDELPQFFNVLKGDMSIVGPRPPLPEEVAKYSERDMLRLSVRPGITCYWQTRPDRYEMSFEDWVGQDIRYIREMSVWTDLKLIAATAGAAIQMTGR